MNKESVEAVASTLEQYRLGDTDELMEYLWLRPHQTGLNVDIFVDDGGSYERHGHVPLLFARNGYGKDCAGFIPFSLSNDPTILDDEIDYGITNDDIYAVKDFILANLDVLMGLADSHLSHSEFIQSIRISS